MWDSRRWREEFAKASAARDGDALRALRRAVWRDTVERVRAGRYEVGDERVVLAATAAEASRRGTVFHADTDALTVASERRGRERACVTVHNADFLEIARVLAADGSPTAVLNMANRRNPGGGVDGGAGAQEENLFRRSTLFTALYQFVDYAPQYGVPRSDAASYPIPREAGGIFSPEVTVFRSAETTGYALLAHPYRINVITVPAINAPDLVERDGQLWLSDAMAAATARKIRAILRIGARHGQTALVLSAFGCGAFRNPPQHVAALFRDVLAEPEFAGVFRRVAFAIIDDHNAFHRTNPEGNYVPFERVFGGS